MLTILKIILIVILIFFIFKVTKFIIKSIIFIVILILVLSLFSPNFLPTKTDITEGLKEKVKGKVDESEQILNCKLQKGRWEENPQGEHFCNLPLEDANKECQNSDECKGFCIAENITTGYCQDYEFIFDCFDIFIKEGNENIKKAICLE